MSERAGQRFGNYRLHRLLGKGGFAEVYLGEHLYLRTSAAIKILHASLDEREEQFFLAEAQTIAQLTHPNIVQVREFAIERSMPFLVMDYAPGGTLRHRYPRGTCLSLEQTISYVKQLASALQYAHNRGIIHRDVKPENVLQGAGKIILSDFGISVSVPHPDTTTSQQWAGTLPYAAPEQYQGKAVFASNQYALAIMAYEWLCGVRPFDGSAHGLAYQHAVIPPPPLREKDPSLPEAVETVILKALSKAPEERYVSIINFARALERASRGESGLEIEANAPTERADAPQRSLSRRVFLSHAAQDNPSRLRDDLTLRDIEVQDDATAEPQEEQMRQAIRAAQVVLLLLTPNSRSSANVQKHLRIASFYRRPIISIWVQGQQLDGLLPVGAEQASIIDAREQYYGKALDEIVLALEREQRGASNVEAALPELDFEPRNPYKGLRAFTRHDRADFFGRTSLVQDLLAQLKPHAIRSALSEAFRPRLLAVLGPSGSGKSSVVMAGLLPRLYEGGLSGSDQWIYLDPLVPGKQPLEAVVQSLAARFPEKGPHEIRDMLNREDGFGLHQLGRALASQPETRVVVTIDQFEELFSPQIPEAERLHFIRLLVAAVTEPRGPVLVLLTLRADFYDRPFAYPELGRLIQQQQSAILPMSVADLREVIERPASLPDVLLTFDEDLVGDLLFDLHGQAAALPLLEFALDQLFHHRRERRLTRFAYQEIGGVRGALSKHAESTYTALPSEEHRRLARTLFMRLVQPAEQGQDPLRRRADIAEFVLENAEQTRLLHEVIDTFITAHLLTSIRQDQSSTLEISHEALIREWSRLTTWIQEAREDMHFQQAMSSDVREWVQRGMPKDRLYRGSQLKESLAWQKRNLASGNEAAFLRASTARRRRGYLGLALIALLLLAILVPAGNLFQQQVASSLVTTLKDDAPGSLRLAIANARPGGTISIDSHLKGVITLNRSLTISKDLTIRGSGVNQLTIRGKRDQGYLIYIPHDTTVTLSQMTFSDPKPSTGSVIRNDGTLTLDTCHLTGNTQTGTEMGNNITGAGGGAIENNGGILTLQNSLVSHNTVTANVSYGAGIDNSDGSTLILKNSQIVDNTATADGQYATGGGINSTNSKITIMNSTIARNKVVGSQGSLVGGGGIESEGDTITLINSTITDNSVAGPAKQAIGVGGAISGQGSTITINNSRISGNTVVTQDKAIGGAIGMLPCPNQQAVVQCGSMTINQSVISNNGVKSLQADAIGGGIFSDTVTITDSLISANSVEASSSTLSYAATGGGIGTQGTVTLNRTTLSQNTVKSGKGEAAGGGLFAGYSTGNMMLHLQLTNCTIADNTVQGSTNAGGGGIALHLPQPQNSSATVDFCTIYGNAATEGGGIAINAPKTSDITLKNSIVAADVATTAPDISGAIITQGYNLIQRFSGALFSDPAQKHQTDIQRPTDLGIDPQLRDNGGPTPTLALQTDSPALNVIPVASCDVAIDQRGTKRPQRDACNTGAYE